MTSFLPGTIDHRWTHLFCFCLELSQLVLCQRKEVIVVFWVLLPAHGLQQPGDAQQSPACESPACVFVCLGVCQCHSPVLCLQGAGQVFGVGVTEGVGQPVLVADLLAVGLGLRGAAFPLRSFTHQERERRSISSIQKRPNAVKLTGCS